MEAPFEELGLEALDEDELPIEGAQELAAEDEEDMVVHKENAGDL